MSDIPSFSGEPARGAPLFAEGGPNRSAARRRAGRLFAFITLVPVILAMLFVAVLLIDVVTDTVSWQVVNPATSGESFSWLQAPFGGQRVVRLELAAQGLDQAEIRETLSDQEERRLFFARNRVELMLFTNDGPFRWVVTSSRDRRVADYGLLAGARNLDGVRQGLGAEERLYLNPWLDASFFNRNASRTPVVAGLRSALAGTLWVIALVILIALPLGIGTAIYLEEYAADNRFTRTIDVNIRNLAGVPSIVYGILGLYVFVRLAGMGPSVLAAALTLALLILPVVVIASREAIRSVPGTLRQASYGLGATKWQTVSRVVLPNAIPGIVTGVILAVARAIGETAPLLLVGAAAFVPYLPDGLLSSYTVIPVQIYSWVGENDPEFRHVASAAILVLLTVLVVLYAIAFYLRRRFERTW
ncbi:MAG: phosphate ABC transporter permease PstA [Trueperaceae bacterium]